MVVFSSLIVFDAETTSLPQLDYHTTKIIELAFLGCEVKHLKASKEPPRVLHKMVLLFNPNKSISPYATKASGLDNEQLENLNPFGKEDAKMLKMFISRLPPPVCIVAHNGNQFDFPILRRALVNLQTVFGNDVYCADSIKAFRKIYPKLTTSPLKKLNTEEKYGLAHLDKTPPGQKTIPRNMLRSKSEMLGVKRELFPDHDKLENWVCTQSVPSHLSSPTGYKLQDVHKFLLGKNFEDAHRAESDSLALLNCIIHCDEFLNWINSNAVIFDSVEPLF